MTSSRSSASTSKYLVLLILLLGVGNAYAERRRVVVLPFDGEKGEKFHSAVVKLVKKSHTVISAEKWESAAEELSAGKFSEKNIKKVAKKLKVDGVIQGSVDKRRDEYIIKLKLYSGSSGTVAGSVSTKAEGPRLDGSASKDVKDELISSIGDLDSVRGGGGGDDEEEPKTKKKKKGDDEEEEPEPVSKKKKGDDEEEEPKKTGFGSGKMKKGDDEEEEPKSKKKKADEEKAAKKKADEEEKAAKKKADEEEKLAKKKKKADDEEKKKKKGDDEETTAGKGDDEENPVEGNEKKRPKTKKGDDGEEVAATGDGDDGETEVEAKGEVGVKMDKALARSPGRRAVDATLGVSFNARRLSWKHDADLAAGAGAGQGRPPAYKGLPAPGAIVDISAYPLAFSHKSDAITTNIGVNVLYDRALLISSKNIDGTKLATASQRIGFGGLFRYPFGKSATSPVIGARLRYGRQLFEIGGNADIPNVGYSFLEPGVMVRFPINEKITANLNASYLMVLKVGDLQGADAYGKGSASGFDIEIGGDYSLGGALFARGTLKVESISHKFDGVGMLTTNRDADMEVDVQGAKDMYIGAAFTVGYLY
jgi:hypothetical protein